MQLRRKKQNAWTRCADVYNGPDEIGWILTLHMALLQRKASIRKSNIFAFAISRKDPHRNFFI